MTRGVGITAAFMVAVTVVDVTRWAGLHHKLPPSYIWCVNQVSAWLLYTPNAGMRHHCAIWFGSGNTAAWFSSTVSLTDRRIPPSSPRGWGRATSNASPGGVRYFVVRLILAVLRAKSISLFFKG
ncbi:hypothetical protein VTK56DRAFT_1904 [Thermocarpiscus australiensis]